MTITQLNELFMEMEVLIRELSETLISELALRDELEYEKELKNSFISLLLAVQNRRRQYHVEKKKHKAQNKAPTGNQMCFFVFSNVFLTYRNYFPKIFFKVLNQNILPQSFHTTWIMVLQTIKRCRC